jgi:hypothetical protein
VSITVNCAIDLTEEELFHVLLRRHGGVIKYPTISTGPESVEPEATTIAPTDYANTPANNVIAPEPPPLPPKPTRRAKTALSVEGPVNATPLAPPPPPEPLDEPAMRSLLSKVGAVHPLKVKAITDLLESHGGARRLSECDPSTWPAIAEAAKATLAEHSA